MGRKGRKRHSFMHHCNRHKQSHSGRESSHSDLPLQLKEEDVEQLESLFNKSFTYDKPSEDAWILPKIFTSVSESWNIDSLVSMKDHLNDVKNKLSVYEIQQWHQHTGLTHRAGLVVSHVRKQIRPELCTQAWCKFFEIIQHSGGVEHLVKDQSFNSVHLCEAPGAFIASLNHLLKSSDCDITWQWIASTLNPYYEGNSVSEMINDDRFMVNTLSNWCFGVDNTGNIMSCNNLDHLAKRAGNWSSVDLVTADGSIDCVNTPGKQEEMVAKLHLCEVAVALHLLSEGGMFVIKVFTQFEASSVCLMYLLNSVFNKVTAFKPSTSKPGNSEVYIICQGFRGIEEEFLHLLRGIMDSQEPLLPLFDLPQIPSSFMEQHVRCCEVFMHWQVDTIEENIRLYSALGLDARLQLESMRLYFADRFIEKYELSPIDSSQRVFPCRKELKSGGRPNHHINLKRHTGSFYSRQQHLNLPWSQKIDVYSEMDLSTSGEQFWMPHRNALNPNTASNLGFVCGQPFSRINSSAFCELSLLKVYSEFLDSSEYLASSLLKTTADFSPGFEAVMKQMFACSAMIPDSSGVTSVVILKRGDSNGPFHCFLQSKTDIRLMDSEGDLVSGNVNVSRMVLFERTFGNEKTALLTSQPFCDLIQAVKLLGPSCHLALSSTPTLTRMSVSIIFLMQQLFRQVYICFSDQSPVFYLFGLNHVPPSDPLSEHLARCSEHLEAASNSPNSSLLSAVATKHLLKPPFYHSICSINDVYLKLRLKALLQQEKTYLSKS